MLISIEVLEDSSKQNACKPNFKNVHNKTYMWHIYVKYTTA